MATYSQSIFAAQTKAENFLIVDYSKDKVFLDADEQERYKNILKLFNHKPGTAFEELDAIVHYPSTRESFYKYLCKLYCEENLEFWVAVERLKYSDLDDTEQILSDEELSPKSKSSRINSYRIHNDGLDILNRFLSDTAAKPINIDGDMRNSLLEVFETDDCQEFMKVFSEAQSTVFSLLLYDSFPKYKESQEYKQIVANIENEDNIETQSSIIKPKKLNKQDWIPDKDAPQCMVCSVTFTLINRRVCIFIF